MMTPAADKQAQPEVGRSFLKKENTRESQAKAEAKRLDAEKAEKARVCEEAFQVIQQQQVEDLGEERIRSKHPTFNYS